MGFGISVSTPLILIAQNYGPQHGSFDSPTGEVGWFGAAQTMRLSTGYGPSPGVETLRSFSICSNSLSMRGSKQEWKRPVGSTWVM